MANEQDNGSKDISQIINGKVYSLDFTDITGVEARDFRLAVGYPLPAAAGNTGTIIDVLEFFAGVKWLIDRRDNPDLSYEKILAELTYDSLKEVEEEAKAPPA